MTRFHKKNRSALWLSFFFYGATPLNFEYGLGGSGLGFYGSAGFGASVQVGAFQGRTFVTNPAGTAQGPECNNVLWTATSSGALGQVGTGIPLINIPNTQCTTNIRFTNGTAVKTQNAQLIIYDRNYTGSLPATQTASGVTTYVAQIIHAHQNQDGTGSGSTTWTVFTPSVTGTILYPTCSPGSGGGYVSGATTVDTQHDWYFAISASPTSIGSKTQYGLYFYVEYL